jgi:Leucine-rich repeat (LRR) protein
VWYVYMLTCVILFSFSLDANNLVGSIPSEICLLNLVQNIDLGENAFQGKIPGCIAYMPSLNRFYADNNQLSGSLPTGPWPALESLTISDNKFSGDLSTVSSMLSLRNLDVHSNQFTGHLPENLFLKSVEKLDFSKNQLSGSLNVLFLGLYANGSFEAASTLRVLHLNDNLFHGGQLGLFFFLGQLEQLTLEGNLLTGDLDGECQRSLDILTADCDHVNCACCTACN